MEIAGRPVDGRLDRREFPRWTSKDDTAMYDAQLTRLGIALPQPVAPYAAYAPFRIVGGLAYVSGQIALDDGGRVITGRLGDTLDIAAGSAAARGCALMSLAQLRAALGGSLDRLREVVRLGIFVNSTDDFHDQPLVANGASDLMLSIFGDAGRHARTAVGVNVLPLGAPVEVEAIYAIG